MATYVYSTVPGKIKTILAKIREVGVPSKLTTQYLKTIGFTSSNDASLITVIKFIGFVDQSGAPTSLWAQYRGGSYKKILGNALKSAYSELYAVYPDAHARPRQELEHFFSTSTSGGKEVIGKLVSTFKILAEEAEFVAGAVALAETEGPLHAPITRDAPPSAAKGTEKPSLHIDIQVHISPESSPEQIEQIFASMAKHLYGRG